MWAAFFTEFLLRDPVTREIGAFATNKLMNFKRKIILWATALFALIAMLLF